MARLAELRALVLAAAKDLARISTSEAGLSAEGARALAELRFRLLDVATASEEKPRSAPPPLPKAQTVPPRSTDISDMAELVESLPPPPVPRIPAPRIPPIPQAAQAPPPVRQAATPPPVPQGRRMRSIAPSTLDITELAELVDAKKPPPLPQGRRTKSVAPSSVDVTELADSIKPPPIPKAPSRHGV